jgi:hypothetical protein
MTNDYHEQEMRRCIDECIECHRACLAAAGEEGWTDGGLRQLLLDCAEICETATDFMLRRSNLHGYVCGLCAHICKVCGDRCDRVDGDVPSARGCAAICHICADTCLRLSKAAAYESMLV